MIWQAMGGERVPAVMGLSREQLDMTLGAYLRARCGECGMVGVRTRGGKCRVCVGGER